MVNLTLEDIDMRLINLVDGTDINYEHFSLTTRTTAEGFFEIVAYSNFNSNRATIATCDKLTDVAAIMKNIALAYEKGIKTYFVES